MSDLKSLLAYEAGKEDGIAKGRADSAARIAELEDALKLCIAELRSEIEGRYPEEDRKYHTIQRRYERDMDIVHKMQIIAHKPQPVEIFGEYAKPTNTHPGLGTPISVRCSTCHFGNTRYAADACRDCVHNPATCSVMSRWQPRGRQI